MSAAPELEPLLAALRLGGFRVGVGEILRLRQVFALAPELPADEPARRLKSLLRAVLLKDSARTAAFDRIVDDWWQAQASIRAMPSPAQQAPYTPPEEPPKTLDAPSNPDPKPARRKAWVWLSLLLPVLAVAILAYWPKTPQPPTPEKAIGPEPGKPRPSPGLTKPDQPEPPPTAPKPDKPQAPALRLVPQITVTPAPPRPAGKATRKPRWPWPRCRDSSACASPCGGAKHFRKPSRCPAWPARRACG